MKVTDPLYQQRLIDKKIEIMKHTEQGTLEIDNYLSFGNNYDIVGLIDDQCLVQQTE